MNAIQQELKDTQEALSRCRDLLDKAKKTVDSLSSKDYSTITRVEVIGRGREYVNHNVTGIELSFQDDNRTLKVFI